MIDAVMSEERHRVTITDPFRKCEHCGNRTGVWPHSRLQDAVVCPKCGRVPKWAVSDGE